MNSLQEEMFKTGLVSKERFKKVEAKKNKKEREKFQKIVSPPKMSFSQWKNEARKRLIVEPTFWALRQIIKETHDLFKGTKHFRRLLFPLYELRDKLGETPREKRKQIIKKILW